MANDGFPRLPELLVAGVRQAERRFWNLIGATVTDNPVADETTITVGGGGGATGNAIVWDAGGGGDATTFADVMTFVAALNAPLDIYVEGTVTVPAGVYEMRGARFIGHVFATGATVNLDDGAVLRNIGLLSYNLKLVGHSTALACLEVDLPPPGTPMVVGCEYGGSFRNEGAVPMLDVPPATSLVFVNLNGNGFSTMTPGVTLTSLGAGSAFVFLCEGIFGDGLSSQTDLVVGPASTSLIIAHDGKGGPYPAQPAAFLGTGPLNAPIGLVGGSGPTATRPIGLFGPLGLGTTYFDSTIGNKPIWWDGATWLSPTSDEQVDNFIAFAAQTVFILSQAPVDAADVELHVNGVLYEQDEYGVVGTTLTWNDTAFVMAGGEEVEARYRY